MASRLGTKPINAHSSSSDANIEQVIIFELKRILCGVVNFVGVCVCGKAMGAWERFTVQVSLCRKLLTNDIRLILPACLISVNR